MVRANWGMTVNVYNPFCNEPGFIYKPFEDLSKISFGLYYKPDRKNSELERFIELMTQLFQL